MRNWVLYPNWDVVIKAIKQYVIIQAYSGTWFFKATGGYKHNHCWSATQTGARTKKCECEICTASVKSHFDLNWCLIDLLLFLEIIYQLAMTMKIINQIEWWNLRKKVLPQYICDLVGCTCHTCWSHGTVLSLMYTKCVRVFSFEVVILQQKKR